VVRGSRSGRTAAAALLSAVVFINGARAGSVDDSLDEVVVSARKRIERAQDVPISMSVRSGEQLAQRNTFRAQEILRSMPNVSTEIQQPRQTSIVIRGLGKNPANDGLEASVGIFLDGVYLGRPGMVVTDLIDIERIEVLRGPQGTLFGKNTTAGALNISTRAPAAEFESWGQASLGNQDFSQLSGAINAPLVPGKLAFRFSAFDTNREGFVFDTTRDEHLGEFDRQGARAQLLWTPSDSARVRFIADYNSQDEDGPGYVLVDPGIVAADGSIRPNNFLDRSARAGYTPVIEPLARRTDSESAQRIQTDQAGLSAQVDVTIGSVLLTSISAWRKWNFRPQNDGDYTALSILPVFGNATKHRQISQELRLASDTDARFDYMVGVYFISQEATSAQETTYGADAADFMTAGLTPLALDGFGIFTNSDSETDSHAVFVQGRWRPTGSWELTAGARWTAEQRAAHIVRDSAGGASLAPGSTAAIAARARLGSHVVTDLETDEDFVSGLLSARYEFSENAMAYLSASRGAKSGGINVGILAPGLDQTLRPEIANSVEIGWKKQWLEHGMQWTLAAFRTDVDDYQATFRDRVLNTFYLTNAGSIRSSGVELESLFRPAPGLELSLAAGWQDARYTSFTSAPCPVETVNPTVCDFTGERVVGSPPWTATGGARYEFQLGSSGYRAFADLEYTHAGAYKLDLSNYTHADSFGLMNLQFGIQGREDRWRAWIWARNLADTDYYTTLATGTPFSSGATIGLLGDPRTYGISLRAGF
jgi:iron complex outermembrane recepter protein